MAERSPSRDALLPVLADGAGDEHGFAEGRLIYRETIVDGLVAEPTVAP